MGIAKYNSECRAIVMRHAKEWEVSGGVENTDNPENWIVFEMNEDNLEFLRAFDLYELFIQETVERMGRWIDFRNDYKTLYPWFMESVWWVFSELYRKGLVYRGVKVMPYSTGCSTPLSNFEAGQNYKDVVDPVGACLS
jgi:isoleucyl-tRNA synthetase